MATLDDLIKQNERMRALTAQLEKQNADDLKRLEYLSQRYAEIRRLSALIDVEAQAAKKVEQ